VIEKGAVDWNKWVRQTHRWLSIVFTMTVIANYHGQPMGAHLPLPIDTPHFDRWLEIFAETAGDVCPPSAAVHFRERAHRIADSLELGIAVWKGEIRPKRARPASTFPPMREANSER
jgi:hemoglobin